MTAVGKLLDRAIDAAMWIGCACSALMMVHISIDVFCRNFLNAPLDGTLEIVSSYYMVTIAFFPLAHVTRSGGQIFVDLFTLHLPRRQRSWIDTGVYVVSTIFLVVLVWRSYDAAVSKMRLGEVWESAAGFLTVWPSRWMLVAGFVLMALCTLRLAFAGITRGADGIEAALRPEDEYHEETDA